jgi:hypothetical protein
LTRGSAGGLARLQTEIWLVERSGGSARRWVVPAATCDGERQRGSLELLKSALQARVRARSGLGERARDGELILGFGGRGEGRTGARGGEERNGSDDELKRVEQRERGGEKGLETLLTTTRSSGVAWPVRIGSGSAAAQSSRAPMVAAARV